jgi:hypothetical protein
MRELVYKALYEKPEIKLCYLFGSYARKTQTRISDIDIGVYAENIENKLWYRAELTAELIKCLKMNDVDLVLINRAPPLLLHRIVCRGVLVFSKDQALRIRLQIEAVNRYNDVKRLISKRAEYL